jgi:malate dehydrogenase (oxaloacetate-decarboxylating)(NADP+)
LKETGNYFNSGKNILEVSVNVAIKVATLIFDSGLATVDRPDDISAFVKSKMYVPTY